MVDVDKLSDAELRTKLLEFGFPVMPITGTTRKVMTKKLKLLLENKNKVGSSDGRRSLGRYSSEEESDTDVKLTKKNRRITMAVPVSSTTTKTKKNVVEPEVVSSSPKKEIRTTTSTTATRSSRIVKTSQADDFDTGSDSESDVVASSNKSNSSLKFDDSYNDVEYNKRSSPIRTTLSSSYSRYSPPKTDDYSHLTTRNVSFGATSSPSRHTTSFGDPAVLSGSLASDYAAEKLNQIRSRLSLGSPSSGSAYAQPASYVAAPSPPVKLEDKDTPFLSNFTRRLSALGSARKPDYDNKNDLVKEHDTNGSSLYGGRSYLSNFRAARGREPTYEYKTRESEGGKSNFVSYGVLAAAALFFVALAVLYLGMRSDTSLVTSGFITPICNREDPQSKLGVNCIQGEFVDTAIFLLNSIKPELLKRSVAYRCFDPTIKPHMTEAEIVTFCQSNFAIKDPDVIRNDLRNLEVLTFLNPEWGIGVAQTEGNDGAVGEEDLAKNMEQVIFNFDKKVTSLVILSPDLPYKCIVYNYLASALYTIGLLGMIFGALLLLRFVFKMYKSYEEKQKDEVNAMVERIIEILQSAALEESEAASYVVINHVRDAILSVKDRKAKQKSWEKAVKYINENESRVRTEVQTVHGESFDVWRWIGSANLSMGGSSPRKTGVWQGQAFDTDPGSANSVAFSPTPCLKIRGMLEEGATKTTATAARDAVLSKIAHRCRVLHCQPEVSSGVIYLKCGAEDDASVAFKNLHGWWYSGQLVTVKYLRLERYQQRFPDAPCGPPYLRSPNPTDD